MHPSTALTDGIRVASAIAGCGNDGAVMTPWISRCARREGYPTTGEYQRRTSGDDTPHSQRVE